MTPNTRITRTNNERVNGSINNSDHGRNTRRHSSSDNRAKKARRSVTPGVARRKEKTYQIALHVLTTQKHNPNADVKPVENPYVLEKLFLQRSKFEQIVEIVDQTLSSEMFKIRFAEHTELRSDPPRKGLLILG
jgi:hypothetical protein